MGVGGTGVGGTAQPPQQWESETQAFVEVTKKYVLGMVNDSLAEVIPFTQPDYDATFKYKTEAKRPMLHPLLFLRASGVEGFKADNEAVQGKYQELLQGLPSEIQDWLKQELSLPFELRDPSFVALNQILIETANTLLWLEAITQPISLESLEGRNYLLNAALPFAALSGVMQESTEILSGFQTWLSEIGPNHPKYEEATHLTKEMEEQILELEILREAIQNGEITIDLQKRMELIATQFEKMESAYEALSANGEFQYLGASLQALSTVARAWALSTGSPSLSIGLSIALSGLSSESNELGMFGGEYEQLLDTLMEGIFNAIPSGTPTQLAELNELKNALTLLKET